MKIEIRPTTNPTREYRFAVTIRQGGRLLFFRLAKTEGEARRRAEQAQL